MTLWRLAQSLCLPRPCGAAMRDTAAASHCRGRVLFSEKENCFSVADKINKYILYVYTCTEKPRWGKGVWSNEWKIPTRLLVIYSTHAFLHLTQSSNIFNNQWRWVLCVKVLVSLTLPADVQNAQDDGLDVRVISIKFIVTQFQG